MMEVMRCLGAGGVTFSLRYLIFMLIFLIAHTQRQLLSFNPVVDLGNSSFLPNLTIHGVYLNIDSFQQPHISTFPTSLKQIQPLIPVPLVSWQSIYSKPCPYTSHTYQSHGMSHLQLYLEFIFFDQDVLEARHRPKPEFLISTSYSSISGTFQAFPNGTLLRNNILYLENDLLLVIESNVHMSPHYSAEKLRTEIQNKMSAHDMIILSKCTGHGKGSTGSALEKHHICLSAYIISRQGARVLSKHYDICGKRLEQQIQSLSKAKLISVGFLEVPLFVKTSTVSNNNETTVG